MVGWIRTEMGFGLSFLLLLLPVAPALDEEPPLLLGARLLLPELDAIFRNRGAACFSLSLYACSSYRSMFSLCRVVSKSWGWGGFDPLFLSRWVDGWYWLPHKLRPQGKSLVCLTYKRCRGRRLCSYCWDWLPALSSLSAAANSSTELELYVSRRRCMRASSIISKKCVCAWCTDGLVCAVSAQSMINENQLPEAADTSCFLYIIQYSELATARSVHSTVQCMARTTNTGSLAGVACLANWTWISSVVIPTLS